MNRAEIADAIWAYFKAAVFALAVGTLVGIERNALTYAGFTVWNQRRKQKPSRDDRRRTMVLRQVAWMTLVGGVIGLGLAMHQAQAVARRRQTRTQRHRRLHAAGEECGVDALGVAAAVGRAELQCRVDRELRHAGAFGAACAGAAV